MYRTVTKCRICGGGNLRQFLNLGETALANSFLKSKDLEKEELKFPLRVLFCEDCNFSQLGEVVSPEILFRDYVYFSSAMPSLPQHFKDYASEVMDSFIASNEELVVELGSNDGILLSEIKSCGPKVLGIDPAINIAKVANKNGITTLPEFFSFDLSEKIVKEYGHAKVIIGNNVVAHIDDHHDLVKGVKNLLENNGVFIFEAPYLTDMFENLTFDTIYHEHLSYLSVKPLMYLFGKYGMEIIDVKTFPVQGVSLRVYAAKKGARRVLASVKKFVKKEKELKLDRFSTYLKLARTIVDNKERLLALLKDLKSKGSKIAGYGAPAKGNTLLNYFGIGKNFLEYATEALPSKIGLFTPGTHVPVIDITEARKSPPDYFLLLAWNYKDAVLEKEADLRAKGVKFIIPVGDPEII